MQPKRSWQFMVPSQYSILELSIVKKECFMLNAVKVDIELNISWLPWPNKFELKQSLHSIA